MTKGQRNPVGEETLGSNMGKIQNWGQKSEKKYYKLGRGTRQSGWTNPTQKKKKKKKKKKQTPNHPCELYR